MRENIIEGGDIQKQPVPQVYSEISHCELISQDNSVYLNGELYFSNDTTTSTNFTISFSQSQESNKILEIDASISSKDNQTLKYNMISSSFMSLNIKSTADEEIYGMGLQYTVWNMKGQKVPVITSEGGVGRGLEPLTFFLNKFSKNQGGNPLTTYAPTYSYITNKNYGALFNSSATGHVDFSQNQTIEFLFWNTYKVQGYLFVGDNPKELVTELSSLVGRMRMIPEWIQQGVVLGLQGGQDIVEKNYNTLKRNGVPIVAVWMQDWVGTKDFMEGTRLMWNWKLNRQQYPDWDRMVDGWQQDGVKPMIYINPYFANLTGDQAITRNLFLEGHENGYFAKNANGTTYLLKSISIEFAMIDFTNPQAVDWVKSIIKENLIEEGRSYGWMQDFGEYAPYDLYLNSSEDASNYHNEYPLHWARVTREVQEEIGEKGKEIVAFMRSGSTMSPKYTDLFWMGDQLPTLDKYDGLQSALIGTLNGGLSGFSLCHSDIGGYTTVDNYGVKITRSREILYRWIEMSTFSDAIMRTHPTNRPSVNFQAQDDDEAAQFFAHFAKIHVALASYKRNLIQIANEQGLPMTRSLLLEYPEDAVARKINDQFMLGNILVAPIFTVGNSMREVYLPQGNWIQVLGGNNQTINSVGQYYSMNAPFGKPLVFVLSSDQQALEILSQFDAFDFKNVIKTKHEEMKQFLE
eukprot:403360108